VSHLKKRNDAVAEGYEPSTEAGESEASGVRSLLAPWQIPTSLEHHSSGLLYTWGSWKLDVHWSNNYISFTINLR
jgi:hypothetical protein